jgi:hypothetical protein
VLCGSALAHSGIAIMEIDVNKARIGKIRNFICEARLLFIGNSKNIPVRLVLRLCGRFSMAIDPAHPHFVQYPQRVHRQHLPTAIEAIFPRHRKKFIRSCAHE